MSDRELGRLSALLESHIEHQKNVNDQLSKLCERHAHWIDGNGKEGAKVRLDRLEQSHAKRSRLAQGGVLIFLGLVIERVWAHLGGG